MSGFRTSGFPAIPTVVKNLLIINGLCFLANSVLETRFNIDLNKICGLYYPGSIYFKPFQIVTHVFMHGSFMHLLLNMFSLWMFGAMLENLWGPKRFFIYYFVTAFGSAFLHTGVNAYQINSIKTEAETFTLQPSYETFISLHSREFGLAENQEFLRNWEKEKNIPEVNAELIRQSVDHVNKVVQAKMNVPTVGASGAVFGLLLAFGMLFPNTILIGFPIFIPLKAKYVVMIYGALELFQGIQNSPADNVAHFAHLGGMLFGFFLIKYWNKKKRDTFY